MKRTMGILAALLLAVGAGSRARAHCQIPCGIYNDEARFTLMEEDVTTIEKSIASIRSLSEEKDKNWNQIVRWVNNKEAHADKLTETATGYFMAQRVKPADEKDGAAYRLYVKKVTLLHQIVVYAMKARQSTDPANVETLRKLIGSFKEAYQK